MELIQMGFSAVFSPAVLISICLGNIAGVILGALPGVSATLAIVLCVSFTYKMPAIQAISFMTSIYCSAITGGSITAILFQIPGTPASAATTFDGYPMSRRGEPGRALSISLFASAFGGLLSAMIMFLLTTPMMKAALKFSSAEQFAVVLLGLGILVFLDEKHMLKCVISGLIGLFMATIGMDYFTSNNRFTFGTSFLLGGLEILPVMVGMFALTEVLKEAFEPSDKSKYSNVKLTKLTTFKEMFSMKWSLIRGSLIGTFVGILPGAGATIASFLSYSTEIKMSKEPEAFGKGHPVGIAASEVANNAATGGTMIPLLSLGIPGGNAAAMMMAVLTMQGVQLGPMLLRNQPEYLSSIFATMIFTNIFMVFVSLVVARVFATVLKIPYTLLGTLICILCAVGSYASSGNINSVYIMVVFGIFGYFYNRFHFNNAALILGLVLGPMAERNLRRAIQMAHYDVVAVFTRPITAAIMLVFFIMILIPIVKKIRTRIKQ